MSELRKSGIDLLGDVPWGTHFCVFYETKEDLLEILVPYFKAGLENNEFCLWVVSEPLTREDAIASLRAVCDFDRYDAAKQIELVTHAHWYLKSEKFDIPYATEAWTKKIQDVLANGFSGMRANGNETWLREGDWADFMEYEESLDNSARDKKMIILCAYRLSTTNPSFMFDVVHTHERLIAKSRGKWSILEDPDIQELKAELRRRNSELEQKVAERTREIEETVAQLKKEIAERIQIAEELKRSEARYRVLIEQACDAIVICDGRGDLLEVNAIFCSMTGYTEAEAIGKNIATLMPAEHLKDHPLRFDLLTLGESISRERLIRKSDGSVFSVEVHAKKIENNRNLAIIRDITSRKEAERTLRESEDAVRRIIDTIPMMAWTTRPDGTIDFANKRWLDYAGEKQLHDSIGMVHPDDAPRVTEKWQLQTYSQQPFEDEMRLRGASGTYRWFLVRTAPVFNEHGEVVKRYGVSIDIEERKKAQDELKLAYQRLSYHVENTPLAVVEWDQNVFIKRWSKRAEEIFGWTAQEAIGKHLNGPDFPFLYEGDAEAVNKKATELMKGLVDRNVSHNRNLTKGGEVIFCEWYNSVLRDQSGNVITILSLMQNVSEREKAGAILKESYDEIRRLTEHLQRVREEERKHIAREIHDELGGQLTVLKMDASWLNQKLAPEDKAIKQKIKNLILMLDRTMKSVRRISSQLRPSMLDDLGLVAAIDWHLAEFEKRSGIKVSFEKPEEDPEVSDLTKNGLFRIFQESLTNVARHSLAKHVKVSLTNNHNMLVLSIEDDGTGFDEQRIAKKRTLGILGMRERTTMLGGKYEISGAPGGGTRVRVALPAKTNIPKPI